MNPRRILFNTSLRGIRRKRMFDQSIRHPKDACNSIGQYLTKLAILIAWAGIASTLCACAVRSDGAGPNTSGEASYNDFTSVWYATVREKKDTKDAAKKYDAERSVLNTGVGIVSFDKIPGLGKIADSATFYIPDERIEVTDAFEISEERFWEDIETFIKENGGIVFYVHGYNTDFEKALRQAAIFQRALKSRHRVLLFSWPADNDLLKYTRDEANLEWSVPRIAQVLRKTITRIGRGRLDVAAHSLGARGVVLSLYEISRESPENPLLNNLVLIAPDIDTDRFRDMWPEVEKMARKISLYVSENDQALKVSRRIHGYPRLGEAGEYLTVLPGMETIDVSSLNNRRLSGHVYHLYNPIVVADLANLMGAGKSAGERPNLNREILKGISYWKLLPNESETQ